MCGWKWAKESANTGWIATFISFSTKTHTHTQRWGIEIKTRLTAKSSDLLLGPGPWVSLTVVLLPLSSWLCPKEHHGRTRKTFLRWVSPSYSWVQGHHWKYPLTKQTWREWDPGQLVNDILKSRQERLYTCIYNSSDPATCLLATVAWKDVLAVHETRITQWLITTDRKFFSSRLRGRKKKPRCAMSLS